MMDCLREISPSRRSTLEELTILARAKDVMSLIGPENLMAQVSRPVLWHTDLHMGNIFVSETDPTEIVSLIDWQSVVVSPLYLQARFPEILSVGPNSAYEFKMDFPKLPENYDTLDPEEKKIAESRYIEAKMAKGYELATGAHNTDGYKALCLPYFLRELFYRCGDVSTEGVLPLKAVLIEILQQWDDLKFSAKPPFSFEPQTLQQLERDLQRYRDVQKVQGIARDMLSTDSEGWIAPQIDFGLKKQENQDLLRYVMAHSADYNMTAQEIYGIWPFKEE